MLILITKDGTAIKGYTTPRQLKEHFKLVEDMI